MTILRHELRQGRTAFAIWTAAIALLLAFCIFLFPEMKGEMDQVGEVFASMGGFTAAFGMDRLQFGTLLGFYAVECGNIIGLGGAFFSSLLGASALSREEKDRTAEFLLTHPVSRARVITGKLAAVAAQVAASNLALLAVSLLSMFLIGEAIPWKEVLLLHAAYVLLQLELAGICFGLSAYLRRGSTAAGLGLAALMYALNLIANMAEKVRFLKWITPFGYCEAADLVTDGRINAPQAACGLAFAAICIAAAYLHYCRKDIR